MPSNQLDFRSVCGCFQPTYINFMLKRVKKKAAIVKLRCRLDGVWLGLILTQLFWGSLLLQAGDVEQNPGPSPMKKTYQTRLASASGGDTNVLNVEKAGQCKEPTSSDIMAVLCEMNSKMDTRFDEMKGQVNELRQESVAMRQEVSELREEVSQLKQQNEHLQKTNDCLCERVEAIERKADDLEGRSKRNNLICYGIERSENETTADLEKGMKDLFRDKLELTEDVELDRIHRLNSKPDSPVIMRCTYYKQKVQILKAKQRLKGKCKIFIGEDFTSRVRDARRKLTPHLRKARNEDKRATMLFDHLLIDGIKYTLGKGDKLVVMK